MSVPCEARTKKGRPCPIFADQEYEGKFLCHVHHPLMTFRQQQAAKKQRKAPVSAKPVDSRKALRARARADAWEEINGPLLARCNELEAVRRLMRKRP